MNKKKITFLFIGIFSVLSLFISSIQTNAQENNGKRISGIITMVLVDEMNELVEFQITDSNGNNYKYKVNISTEFGLDESSGDRWVSTQKNSPKESAIKLIEHQKRYAPVTIIYDGEYAKSVVEREEGRLENNLSYLFSFFLITWIIFFLYIFYLGKKQKIIESTKNFVNTK
ncbi:MAG: hypothetical protein FI675_01870 [SAR202 cluster bacterium]|nr:hypothetical protein [SAR202 cluster bacterium]|tara:strand:- start:2687 stop:3202 length:516 start_codon:yes stop_codon:yes gene_type:complete